MAEEEKPLEQRPIRGDTKWLKGYALPETQVTTPLGGSSSLTTYMINPAKLSPDEKCVPLHERCSNKPIKVLHFIWHNGQDILPLCKDHADSEESRWKT